MRFAALLAVFTGLILSVNCFAADDDAKPAGPVTLHVGDAAPAIAVDKWVKGDAVPKFEKGTVYVVEFWATWCGPCKQSIPHVSELQAKYKDKGLVVIGVDVWEEDGAEVEPFVKNMGDKMAYRVATDDAKKMAKTWMDAAGQDGIPAAFVIDKDSKIAWIGHPMEGMDRVVAAVIDGKFDAAKEAELVKKAEELEKAVNDATDAEQWDKALASLDELIKIKASDNADLKMMRFNLLLSKKDYDGAYKYAAKLGETDFKDDGEQLNNLAWTILDEQGLEKRDLDVALKLAERGVEVTKRKNAPVLDTLARAYFDKGNVDKAIQIQMEAVERSGPDEKDEIEETLKKYQEKKGVQ